MLNNQWNQIRISLVTIVVIFAIGLFAVALRGQSATNELSQLNAEVVRTTALLKETVRSNCLTAQKSAHLHIELEEDLIVIDSGSGDVTDKQLGVARLKVVHQLESQIPSCAGL